MKSLGSFLREVKIELSKVVWPRKEEFVGSVVVVLITLVMFAIFFGVINYAFQTGALKGFQVLMFGR
ncbi:MAG: preprotein translocase subunit SecE [Epsilonproteobacteria bacterium]|nr:preprotein translocase subunit SecE [Campylobacterota bacterium]|tara:strand:- start:339 stop:539 length:201 start_codon:yes stop_codon:yes gene_type:complete